MVILPSIRGMCYDGTTLKVTAASGAHRPNHELGHCIDDVTTLKVLSALDGTRAAQKAVTV
jgi:hypothetical protein